MGVINNRYSTMRKFSEGNMTNVYLCADISKGLDEENLCVVKLFNKEADDNTIQLKIFNREVESLQNLQHPNIIKIIDKGFDNVNKAYFIVLDYFDGEGLDKFLKHNDEILSDNDKLKIINQILDAIRYSHNKNIIHRDLKPSNILIDKELNIKIIDYGVSKLKDTFYSDYTLKNYMSFKYASPEQKIGIDITYKSDIYSLGIIIYEILLGRTIDSQKTIQELLEDDKTINPSYKEMLQSMVQMDVNKRVCSVKEILEFFTKECKLNNKEFYYLGIANSVVKKLYKLGYITIEDRSKAIKIIQKDIEDESFIERDKMNSNDENLKFNIYGKQFTLNCVIDRFTRDSFTAIKINVKYPGTHESNKDLAMPVDFAWKIINRTPEYVYYHIDELIERISVYSNQQEDIKNQELAQKGLVEKWSKVLRLQRQNIEKSKYTLKYRSFEVNESNSQIKVKLKEDIDELPYIEDQALTMTSKNNIHKQIDVGYFLEYKDEEIIINLNKKVDIKLIAESGELEVNIMMMEYALRRQEKALSAIKYNECVNSNLSKILIDPKKARNNSALLISDVNFNSNNLDTSKRDSVLKALQSEDIFLLQGPPGTGKTTFITELVTQILSRNTESKILISSQSNVAVDHALVKIKEVNPNISMIRVGRREKLSENVQGYMIEEYLEEWTHNVIRKTKKYLEEFKKYIHINEAIRDKYNLILEIEKLQDKVSNLDKKILENKIELDETNEKYFKVNETLEEIKRFSIKVKNKSKEVIDDNLINIINNFMQDYLNLGNEFLKNIDESNEISTLKYELEHQIEEIETEKTKMLDDINAGKNLLEVKDDFDYYQKKIDIESKVKENEEEYKKLSNIESIVDEWIERIGTGEDFLNEAINSATIIGATCLGVANIVSTASLVFDWVIIDEAGRATPPEILVPMVLGKRVVLVGDHKQLPPIIDSQLDNKQLKELNIRKSELEESLFEYIAKNIGEECKQMLSKQYRMSPGIGDLIGNVFYDNELESGITFADRDHGLELWKNKSVVWMSTSKLPNRFEKKLGTTYINKCEIDVIFKIIKQIDKECIRKNITKEVGVIAGYQAQKSSIRKEYESQYKSIFKKVTVEINTVDAFQGRETDIILYSIVRSNKSGNIGFLRDMRRLNVALSRARELLILVGDHECVTKNRYLSGNYENPFSNVLEYINKHSKSCELKEV